MTAKPFKETGREEREECQKKSRKGRERNNRKKENREGRKRNTGKK